MAENYENDVHSTLAAQCNAGATTLSVATGHGAKFPASNFRIRVDDEIMLCTSRTGDTFTVARAQETVNGAATDATHMVTATVSLVLTKASLQQIIADEVAELFGGWTAYTPNWTATDGIGPGGTAAASGRYKVIGTTMFLQIIAAAGAAPTWGTHTVTWYWMWSLPGGYTALQQQVGVGHALDAGNTNYVGSALIDAGSSLLYVVGTAYGVAAQGLGWYTSAAGTGNPFVFAANDVINIAMALEVT